MFTGSKHVGGCFPPSARGLKHSTRAAPVLETWDLPDLPNLKVAWDTHSPCSERIASCFSVFHVDSIGYFWVAKHGQKIGDFSVIQRTSEPSSSSNSSAGDPNRIFTMA